VARRVARRVAPLAAPLGPLLAVQLAGLPPLRYPWWTLAQIKLFGQAFVSA
jgi:hypothetical protein